MATFLRTILVLPLCGGFVLGAAPDWHQWRGPNRDGISTETGLLKQWPSGGPRLLWKAQGLGSAFASVTVAGNAIFTQGDKGARNYVIALKREDGTPLWETELGRSGAPGWGGYAGPRCVPTVEGPLVFAVGQYGEVACLDAASGQVKWRKDYIKDFGGKLPEWGYSGMPLVIGDKVILTPGGDRGNLVALNKTTGALIWQSKELTDNIHYSSPILAVIGGVTQIIQLTDAHVAGVAAENGQVLWRARRKGTTAVIPTPVHENGLVYVTSEYGIGCNLFQVTATGGKFTARQVYANKVMVNKQGGVVKVGEHVYGFSTGKGWTCQDFKTGEAVWQERGRLDKGSIIYADGRLYLRAEDGKGTVALIEATPTGYKEHGRFDPPHRSDDKAWAHPAIADGKLYLRDQDILLCYDIRAQ